jgi:predicted house-cleaning noncanonical NTP pyrophosphatase (MazG superfamily)
MAKENLRAVPCTGSVLGLIEGAYSELEALRDEVQEIVDNASEGLSQTQRIQTFEETASALDFVDSVPDVPEAVQDFVVEYTEDKRKSKSTSRATRCAEAVNLLQCVIEVLTEFSEAKQDSELCDEIEQLLSELEDAVGYAEGAEFPGMYG